jgi:ADP-dependent NAD(P)H-hydrate dehydratase
LLSGSLILLLRPLMTLICVSTAPLFVPLEEVSGEWVRSVIPPRRAGSRKGENGVVVVIGGSGTYHGAPFLTAMAAMRSGVDLAYLYAPERIVAPLRALSPSLIVMPYTDLKLTRRVATHILSSLPRANSAAVGPGLALAKEEALLELLSGLLERGLGLVVDASALQPQILGRVRGGRVVLTPHAGEFQRVFGIHPGEGLEERVANAQRAALDHQVTILLKGPIDVITDGQQVFINRTGNCAMTVGGTGDVLTGLVAGIMAKGVAPAEAAAAAAYINGVCGDAAMRELGLHILPTDIIEMIPRVMKNFDRIVS